MKDLKQRVNDMYQAAMDAKVCLEDESYPELLDAVYDVECEVKNIIQILDR